jgi:hypothetical protein
VPPLPSKGVLTILPPVLLTKHLRDRCHTRLCGDGRFARPVLLPISHSSRSAAHRCYTERRCTPQSREATPFISPRRKVRGEASKNVSPLQGTTPPDVPARKHKSGPNAARATVEGALQRRVKPPDRFGLQPLLHVGASPIPLFQTAAQSLHDNPQFPRTPSHHLPSRFLSILIPGGQLCGIAPWNWLMETTCVGPGL